MIAEGFHVIVINPIAFVYLLIDFVLVNTADPDEMLHYEAFYLCLHCLPKNLFWDFWSSKGHAKCDSLKNYYVHT